MWNLKSFIGRCLGQVTYETNFGFPVFLNTVLQYAITENQHTECSKNINMLPTESSAMIYAMKLYFSFSPQKQNQLRGVNMLAFEPTWFSPSVL